MNIEDEALAQTEVLKTLPRFVGTEHNLDYFEVLDTGKVRYGVKVDFVQNYFGHPVEIFARVRATPSEKIEVGNFNFQMHMEDEKKIFEEGSKITAMLKSDEVKASALKCDMSRMSFVLMTGTPLEDYGDPSDPLKYGSLIDKLQTDMLNLGSRVYIALGAFEEVNDDMRHSLQRIMLDYAQIMQPEPPAGYISDKNGKVKTPTKD